MDDQVGVDLCIGIQESVHPFRSHPAVGFSLSVTTPVKLGAGLHNSLQIKRVGIQEGMDQRVHVIHFSVLRYQKSGLALKGRQGCVSGKCCGHQADAQYNRQYIGNPFFHVLSSITSIFLSYAADHYT